jgi:glutaredoxin 3
MDVRLTAFLQRADVDFVLFTTRTCQFCVKAKMSLDRVGFSWQENNVSKKQSIYSRVVMETGLKTVPAIFDMRNENPVFVGGFEELIRMLKMENRALSARKGFFGFFRK